MSRTTYILGLILLSGCAQQQYIWVKPDASQNDFNVDNYTCLQEAQQRVGRASVNAYYGEAVNTVQTNQQLYVSCMNAHGWQIRPKPTGQQQAAQQAQSNPLQDALNTYKSEAEAYCRDPELQPFFVKSPCEISNATLEQLSDSSKINDEQKPALQKAQAASTEPNKKLIQAFRQYGGQKGNAIASLLEKIDGQSDANDLDLYSGKITWGEYNRRRKDQSVQGRDQINEIRQSK